jgi:4-amino-4-deoxy-L-arabinose transferase-like glycosyltransferase
MTKNNHWWTVILLIAAVLLFGINLGGLPLRDWDEGIVAQVAREIWRAAPASQTWLHPTIAGLPYLSKPPLMHWLMAIAYRFGGVQEWTSRLPGAMLTAISVPLLYGIGRELFPRRPPAILAALIYLTLLPVVRHGRLAMLDGAVLCFFLLLLLCLLKARRDLRWGLGVGISFGLLCLTKGIVAILLGAIALIFLILDTPRLLTSGYVWSGFLLGCLPVALWYGAQWLHYGQQFIDFNLGRQSVDRIFVSVESNSGPVWYYLLEILKYGMPWLLFLPQGFRLAWENRNLSWAKLVLSWTGGYLLVISLMSTKLPWYVLPVYPALALVAGASLAEVWQLQDWLGARQESHSPYPTFWIAGLSIAAIAGWASSIYFEFLAATPQPDLVLPLVAAALTMTASTIQVLRQNSQFIPVLIWGSYVSLLLFMGSNQWIWELNEAYPVKPVAALISQHVPPGQNVLTSYSYNRPSLNFYSDRAVIPATLQVMQETWQKPSAYLLVRQESIKDLNLPAIRQLGQAEGWILLTRQ